MINWKNLKALYSKINRGFLLAFYLMLVANICKGQKCAAIDRLFNEESSTNRLKLKDSLIDNFIREKDTMLLFSYETCLAQDLNLLNARNVDVICQLSNNIDDICRPMLNNFNKELLNAFWYYVADSNATIRVAVNTYFDYHRSRELFECNQNARKQLKILLQMYPAEYYYIWEIEAYKFNELVPLLKQQLVIKNKGITMLERNQKWAALNTCYSMGDKTIFPLIRDFINKEENIIEKYSKYDYLFGRYNSGNERNLLLEVLKRNDILTEMPEDERSDISSQNYFTQFIFYKIPRLFKEFNTDDIRRKCDAKNSNDNTKQAYYTFQKKCLYDETIKWFKEKKLLK